MDLEALVSQRGRLRRVARVQAEDLAAGAEHAHCRGPGAREADHEIRPGRQRRPPRAGHLIDCWYSVNPIDEQIAATIQKRRMIFVSDHARSSK